MNSFLLGECDHRKFIIQIFRNSFESKIGNNNKPKVFNSQFVNESNNIGIHL